MRCAVLVLVTLFVAVARAGRVTDGLAALYTFEEGQTDNTVTVAQDVSGVSPSLLGPISFVPSQVAWRGNSVGLAFSGSGTRVSAQTANNISALVDEFVAGNGYTIEAWISMIPADWERNDKETLVMGLSNYSTLYDDPPGPEERLVCPAGYDDANDTTTPGAQFFVSRSGGMRWQWRSEVCGTLGDTYPEMSTDVKPHSFTITYGPRPSNLAKYQMDYFIDGTLIGFGGFISFEPSRWPKNKVQFAPPTLVPFNSQTDMWRGSLFQFAVYSRKLNATEVAANHAAGIPNSKPFAVTRTDTLAEDTPSLITLTGTDFDNDTITFELLQLSLVSGSSTSLRYANGSEVPVTQADLPLDLDPDVTGIAFTPPLHAIGAAGSITYRARDATKASNPGVISLNLEAVNDPPKALDAAAAVTAEVAAVLSLNGSDVDAGDTLDSARISTLPSNGGSLYLYNDSASDKRGAAITAAPAVLSGLRVVYVSDTLPANSSGVSVVATDSFSYYVRDNSGAESAAPATFAVSVRNNLFAEDFTASTDEDATATITFPYDSSVSGTVSIVVETLPATNGSVLLKASTTAPLAAADLPYTIPNASATLQCRPAPDLYGDPLDTLTFHAVREGGWLSGSATCRVAVSPVNDPPTATLPRGEDGEVTTLELVANQAEAATFTVSIQDPDADDTPYRVTVNVLAFGAYINLNTAAVESSAGSIEFRSGDGVEDGLVIFLALRADLNALFDGIELHAAGEANGTVAFLVSDEAAGGVEISFAIPFVASKDPALAAPAGSDLPLALQWSFVVGAALLVVYACYLCCCRAHRRHHSAEY